MLLARWQGDDVNRAITGVVYVADTYGASARATYAATVVKPQVRHLLPLVLDPRRLPNTGRLIFAGRVCCLLYGIQISVADLQNKSSSLLADALSSSQTDVVFGVRHPPPAAPLRHVNSPSAPYTESVVFGAM